MVSSTRRILPHLRGLIEPEDPPHRRPPAPASGPSVASCGVSVGSVSRIAVGRGPRGGGAVPWRRRRRASGRHASTARSGSRCCPTTRGPSSSRRPHVVRSRQTKVASETSRCSEWLGGGTSIIGRPRRLPSYRRADPRSRPDYAVNCHELVYHRQGMTIAEAATHFGSAKSTCGAGSRSRVDQTLRTLRPVIGLVAGCAASPRREAVREGDDHAGGGRPARGVHLYRQHGAARRQGSRATRRRDPAGSPGPATNVDQ
jgi:hypothetical protein